MQGVNPSFFAPQARSQKTNRAAGPSALYLGARTPNHYLPPELTIYRSSDGFLMDTPLVVTSLGKGCCKAFVGFCCGLSAPGLGFMSRDSAGAHDAEDLGLRIWSVER